ncbi:MAG: S8/S53 family peptidase [Acidobacteriaceae bacterium]|nr:S8/S53 family peptidase [Acidobacteriaceae bacterium]
MTSFEVKRGAVIIALCALGVGARQAQAAQRIHGEIEDGRSFALAGNTHPMVQIAHDLGPVDPSLPMPRITIHLAMTTAQKADLDRLLQAQQTRGSREYHKWLTPEQYASRFGVSESDIQKITLWLENLGFTNIEASRSRNAISFSGTAAQVQAAFQTPIHQYEANGEQHYANAKDPVLPKPLSGVIEGIRGLSDFHPKPRVIRSRASIEPHFTSSISGNHFLVPDDFATIYNIQPLYGSGIDGAGQKIAVAGQSDIALKDIQAFRSAAGLPPHDPQVILDGTDPGTNSGDESEADLDIEWAGGVARNATIVYVNSKDAFTSATYAVTNNVASILVLTYGNCESAIGGAELNTLNTIFKQANAQGMTVLAASGDDGAADCEESTGPSSQGVSTASHGLAVDFPASSPYVTGVGGTELNDCTGNYWNSSNNSYSGSVLSYIPEVGWNDSSTPAFPCGSAAGVLSASGGGKSSFESKPSWQRGTGVPSDGFRDVPDLAFAASPQHDGYLVCSGGSCVNGFRNTDTTLNVIGGTSATVPSFAGIVALLNQKMGGSQGNVNQTLYNLASFSTNAFHDITSGNNQVPCKTGSPDCPASLVMGYTAGAGYDQVTGLGSVDAYNLINEWASDFQVAVNPTGVTLSAGGSGTAAVQVTPMNNFAGTVSFSCTVPTTLANVTCSVPGTVSSSGTATVTVTAAATAALRHFRGANPWSAAGPQASLLFGGVALITIILILFLDGKRRLQSAGLGFAVLCLAVAVGCGDGSSSSTAESVQPVPETGTITITATAGVLSHTTTLSVTVQ